MPIKYVNPKPIPEIQITAADRSGAICQVLITRSEYASADRLLEIAKKLTVSGRYAGYEIEVSEASETPSGHHQLQAYDVDHPEIRVPVADKSEPYWQVRVTVHMPKIGYAPSAQGMN